MRIIPLTQGKFAIVDEDMFDELNQFKWFYHCGYARRNSEYVRGQKRHAIHMSRVVARVPNGAQCDHRSLDRCDNRRSNLRVATPSQNACNKHVYKNSRTGAKGVDFHKWSGKYRARIQIDKKPIMIGYYPTIQQASEAYAEAAAKHHGEFARL
jgi:hypothetical protein